jgi:hypothetical protein
MRLFRPPFAFLLAWTVLCALPVAALLPVVTRATPPPGTCFEWCDVDKLLANGVIRLVTAVWIVVGLIAVWRWNRGQPTSDRRARSRQLAGSTAVLAAAALAGSLVLAYSGAYEFFAVLVVVASALQLVAANELAAWTRPRAVATTALCVMTLATLALTAALIFGTSVYSPFWQVSIFASLAFLGALLALIARATVEPIPGRLALIVLALATAAALAGYAIALLHLPLPDPVRSLVGTALPSLSIAGWALFGIATLVTEEHPLPPPDPEVAVACETTPTVQRPRTPPPFPGIPRDPG